MSGGIYCVHPNGRKLPSPQPEGQGHDNAQYFFVWFDYGI